MRFRYLCLITSVSLLAIALAPASGDTAQDATREATSSLAVNAGQGTFRQFCAPCHGVDAKGRGPIAAVLNVPPADLTSAERRNNGQFPLARLEAMLNATGLQSAAHGSTQMPVWGATFRQIDNSETLVRARIANLLAYLESIQE